MLLGILPGGELGIQGNGDFFIGVVIQAGEGFLSARQLIAVGVEKFPVDAVFFPLFRVLQLFGLEVVFLYSRSRAVWTMRRRSADFWRIRVSASREA